MEKIRVMVSTIALAATVFGSVHYGKEVKLTQEQLQHNLAYKQRQSWKNLASVIDQAEERLDYTPAHTRRVTRRVGKHTTVSHSIG